METTFLTKWWRPSRLVLTCVPQRCMDFSGHGTLRSSAATSKVQALEEEQVQMRFLETYIVDQRYQVGKCKVIYKKKIRFHCSE